MWFIIVIAIISGVSAGLFDDGWPPAEAFLLLVLLFYQLWRQGHTVVAWIILSYLISSLHLAYRFDQSLPLYLSGQSLKLTGEVIELLPSTSKVQRFSLQVHSCEFTANAQLCGFNGLVRLSWYPSASDSSGLSPMSTVGLQQGQYWQLHTKLFPIHGFLNQGQQRYRLLQFAKGFSATGYVRKGDHLLLAPPSTIQQWLSHWHNSVNSRLQQLSSHPDTASLLQALILGRSQHLQTEHWQLLQRTGTVHLVVISGLHLALLLWMGWQLTALVGRVLPLDHWRWYSLFNLLPLLLLLPLLILWPFGVAVQRALLMLLLIITARMLAFYPSPWRVLACAAASLLLLNPFLLLQAGFYYSFLAVLILLLQIGRSGSWLRLLPLQMTLFLGLIGIQSFWQNAPDFSSILANVIAIPLITLFFLPCTLAALILPFSWSDAFFSTVLDQLVQLFWQWLQLCQSLNWPILQLDMVSGVALLLAALVFAVPKLPYRTPWVVMVTLIALIPRAQSTALQKGQFKAEVLDVGQGLAVFISTQRHLILYDTGPRFPSGFAPITLALQPRLQQQQLQLDQLIISHSDNDHAGAAAQLKDYYKGSILTGQTEYFSNSKPCEEGQKWQWDQVQFELLHPPANLSDLKLKDDNQHSCVLKVSSLLYPKQSLLLTGDIDQQIEQRLIRLHPEKLQADWLVASHHGSATGNHLLFLKQVQPQGILYSAGYRNRFGHPSTKVQLTSRYLNIDQYLTADMGALTLMPTAEGGLQLQTELSRLPLRWLWQH